MSKREQDLRALLEVALELPDEELARLENFARYLKERNKPPIMDRRINDLREFAESRGAVLHAILFEEAGIGLQWFEGKQAGEEPRPNSHPSPSYYRQALEEWDTRGLVVYGYYPTLSEAIAREWERLEAMEEK